MVDRAAMQRENAFHTLAEADLSNRDGIAHARVVARDERAFEDLDALFFAFLNLDVHLEGVAWTKHRDVRAEVFLDEIAKQLILHDGKHYCTPCRNFRCGWPPRYYHSGSTDDPEPL